MALGLALVGCAGGAAGSGEGPEEERVNVFVAASFEEVVGEALADLDSVNLNAGGSNTLVDQMNEGAPADVLITADQAAMDRAVELGLVEDPQPLATNELVIALAPDNPAGIATAEDAFAGHRLVVCAPEVPCGTGTAAIFAEQGVTPDVVSEEQSVTDVSGKVASGEADAGIVYVTDALAAGLDTIELPGATDHPTTAWIATYVEAGPRAAEIRQTLLSEDTAALLEERGFGAVDGGASTGPSGDSHEEATP